jgi:DnaJ-domain-containing protein 1
MTVRIASLSLARAAQIYKANSSRSIDARPDQKNSLPRGAWEEEESDSVHFSHEAMEKARLLQHDKVEENNRRQRLQKEQDEALRKSLELLDSETNAPVEAIKRAYRHLIKHYHPDKYADLPPEFRELAEAKSRQIIQAYKKAYKILEDI